LLDGGARSASIAGLIGAQTSRPVITPAKAGGFPISVRAVLSDQQIGGAPDVEIGLSRGTQMRYGGYENASELKKLT
jgi:hypothetical protein